MEGRERDARLEGIRPVNRDLMYSWTMAQDVDSMLPIFVISHDRVDDAVLLHRANDTPWPRPDLVNVVVHKRFAVDYQLRFPNLTIHTHEEPDGCGRARWAAVRIARELGHKRVIMMDDDIVKMVFKYKSQIKSGPNKGAECSSQSGKAEALNTPGFEQHILAGASVIANEVFDTHPDVIIGGLIKQHMSFRPGNHRERYVINGRVTPRQVMFWDLDRIAERGLSLDQSKFGWTGEDIGNVDQVLGNGYDCFAIPCYTYDHWSEEVNIDRSRVRNRENKREILDLDFANFSTLPIFDLLRFKRDKVTQEYEWSDVNWAKLHKHRGTSMEVVEWDEAEVLEELLRDSDGADLL